MTQQKKKAASGRTVGPWMQCYGSVLEIPLPEDVEWSDDAMENCFLEAGLIEPDDFYGEMDAKIIKEELDRQISTLTDREMKVIVSRYFEELNQKTVGELYNVCRDRIGQIEAKALRKLRHPARSEHLRCMIEGKAKKERDAEKEALAKKEEEENERNEK